MKRYKFLINRPAGNPGTLLETMQMQLRSENDKKVFDLATDAMF